MITAAFDIETATNDRASDWFDKVEVKAPSNYRDPAKIEAYITDQKAKLMNKGALSWATGRVISCAIVNIDDRSDVRYNFNINEKELLKDISVQLSDVSTLWGMNNQNFDNPFLIGRFMFHKLPVPQILKDRANDINNFFGYSSQSGQRGSLDSYLHGLGMELKPMKGSQIPKMFTEYMFNLMLKKNPEQQEHFLRTLEEYNISDAVAVADIVERYTA